MSVIGLLTGSSMSLLGIGADRSDDPDVRLLKRLLVGLTLAGMVILAVVGAFFLMVGATVAGLAYMVYLAANAAMLLLFKSADLSLRTFVVLQMVLVMLVAVVTTLALGGIANSGGALFYGFLSPIAGLIYFGARAALLSFAAFAFAIAITVFAATSGIVSPILEPTTAFILLGINASALGVLVIVTLSYFVAQRDRAFRLLEIEEAKSEALLLNILPESVASVLRNGERTVAKHYDQASILFADVVDFTPLAAGLPPATVVDLLNEVFTEFDRLVEQYELEKIKTIGDAYMVAAGVPEPREDHALVITQLACDMLEVIEGRDFQGCKLVFRIGINSGPVVAGVIGRHKFSYDLWGDTVNVASRIEEAGVPGRIQLTETTRQLISSRFETELRDELDLKGKGRVLAYLLIREPRIPVDGAPSVGHSIPERPLQTA